MIYSIFLLWIIGGLIVLAVLMHLGKIEKDTKVHKWISHIVLTLPSILVITYYSYSYTETIAEFFIILGMVVITGVIMALYYKYVKKYQWVEYLLFILIITFYLGAIVMNHYLLEGLERHVVITLGVITCINYNKKVDNPKTIAIGMAIATIVICIIIDYNIDDRLKIDNKIARTVIDYAIEEGVTDSRETDIIIYDAKKGEEVGVSLFHESTGDKSFTEITTFTYYKGDVWINSEQPYK